MKPTLTSIPLFLCLLGCGGDDVDTDTDEPTETAAPTDVCGEPGDVSGEVVTLTTRDGVDLEADLYAGPPGCPGIVLLHMIPPSNTRADWPPEFISKLTGHGWSVLALDRRGAGGSDGTPEDSYIGEKGAYDAEVAVAALTDAGAEGLVLIGASNGTTTVLDYAMWAPGEGLPEPIAMGFMTGGAYSEAQNAMTDAPDVPAFFTFSTDESAWSLDQELLGHDNWTFLEYRGGAHGTSMFDAKPKVKTDIEEWLVGVL